MPCRKSRCLKRWMVFVVTGLLAVVTTVAVSWGCALWVDPFANGSDNPTRVGASDLDIAADATFNCWGVQIFEAPGVTSIRSVWYDEDATNISFSSWPYDHPKDVLPRYWGDAMRPDLTDTSGKGHLRLGDAWGWPFVAIWTKWRRVDVRRFVHIYECDHGIRLNSRVSRSGGYLDHDRALPLAIIWQGFALNTLVYWAAWLVLYLMFVFTVGGAQRSVRRRKGRCTKCGYDLQGSAGERCPECGTQLQ